jgi:hypothetical protein
VRLNAHLAPPHWERKPGAKWDDGYEKTGFFLQFLEDTHGSGAVRALNGALRTAEWQEAVFVRLTGGTLEQLWQMYCEQFPR